MIKIEFEIIELTSGTSGNDTKEDNICPECGSKKLVNEGGCWKCLDCGYSKCDV